MEDNIKDLINKLFIKKECNITSEDVISAISTCIYSFAHLSNIITPSDAKNIILDVYKTTDKEKISSLSPEEVKNTIGFNINFENLNETLNEYNSNRELYDTLFAIINDKILEDKEASE